VVKLTAAIVIVLATVSWPALSEAATARFDRDRVNLGETVELVIEVENPQSDARPDLSPLTGNFDIVSKPRTESQLRIVNGASRSTLRVTVVLAPLSAGEIRIPALRAGSQTTNPLALRVLEPNADSAPEVFLETIVEPESPYVQSEISYRVQLFHRQDLLSGNITEPSLEGAPVLQIGDDTSSSVQRHGQTYQVIERRYAIFPQSSGRVTLSAPKFVGEVAYDPRTAGGNQSAGTSSSTDPFASFFRMTRNVYARGEAMTLDIRPIPDSFTGQPWLPAQAVKLTESWAQRPVEFRLGEPATRILTMTVVGLSESQVETLPTPPHPTLKTYPDKPERKTVTDGKNVITTLTFKVAIVPTQAGSQTLPAIEVHWWDTRHDQARVAHLPERKISVRQPPPSDQQAIQPDTPMRPIQDVSSTPQSSLGWWLSAALFVLWLITALAWIRARKRPASAPPEMEPAGIRANRKALKQACLADDLALANQALLGWAQLLWPEDPPRSLLAVADRLEDTHARAELEAADRASFGEHTDAWRGASFWESMNRALSTTKPSKRVGVAGKPSLPALYPRLES